MRNHIHVISDGMRHASARVRNRLRRLMPRVAIVAALLFVLWLLVHNSRAYQDHFISWLFGLVTFLVVSFTAAYFGLKALRWLKRRLLWRVRRRLVITYLLVGLTPVILLALLGFIFAFGGSNRAMSRVVAAQMDATAKEALATARNLAEALPRLPPNASDGSIQAWLDERTALLQPSLPGARVALWRGAANEEAATLARREAATFVSVPDDEQTRGVGSDTTPIGAPLPEWLHERAEWSGLAYIPAPVDSREAFATPSVRAVVRDRINGQAFVLMLAVPVSRALVQHIYDNSRIKIHPFFIDWTRANIKVNRKGSSLTDGERNDQEIATEFNRDQFGEPIGWKRFHVRLPVTNWINGAQTQRLAFWVSWSWDQLLGGGMLDEDAQTWQRVLIVISTFLLVLELLALLAAAWMTRAITGTVHRLYRATEFIKRGDFSHRVGVRSHDQLGELAAAFNDMSANVESLLQERVKHERLEREVEIAADVQAQLFPREVPHLETAEIAGECRAARGVAGDYYDYVEIGPGFVALALGDVSGKGISASLVMSNLQAALRAQATIMTEHLRIAERAVAAGAVGGDGGLLHTDVIASVEADRMVAGMTANINEQLCRSTDSNRFATLFLALYDDRTHLLRYTNAGHNAVILARADGTTERLTAGGTIVGAFNWARYEEAHTLLEAGDLLLIFSDGISEAQNTLGEEYGEERLAQFVIEHRNLSAEEMRRVIFDEIDKWSGSEERGDDQTLVIIKSRVWSLESRVKKEDVSARSSSLVL